MDAPQPFNAGVHVGCAGWTLPRAVRHEFPAEGSHLQCYSARFGVTEINSAFHRPHRPQVYARWAESVPAGFRFSVKVPKTITHERKLADSAGLLDEFFEQAGGLGDKLGCVLLQLPPKLEFDARTAGSFIDPLRRLYGGDVACEPRHASWFDAPADALLREARIARVLADPVRHEPGRWPGGWPGLVYLRLHGSPRTYYSSYAQELIEALALRMRQEADAGVPVWCIFDNTASGAAAGDALRLLQALGPQSMAKAPADASQTGVEAP